MEKKKVESQNLKEFIYAAIRSTYVSGEESIKASYIADWLIFRV